MSCLNQLLSLDQRHDQLVLARSVEADVRVHHVLTKDSGGQLQALLDFGDVVVEVLVCFYALAQVVHHVAQPCVRKNV